LLWRYVTEIDKAVANEREQHSPALHDTSKQLASSQLINSAINHIACVSIIDVIKVEMKIKNVKKTWRI